MAYALSFGYDFFQEEEQDGLSVRDPARHPTSVAQALASLSAETWLRLAREIFGCEPKYLDIETVLQKVEETNTCLNLDSPVEVAIDPEGGFTVLVYDRDQP